MNDAIFFAEVRERLFDGLNQSQVDGLNAILTAWKGYDIRWGAYALATAFLETDKTMQPIHEKGGNAYFTRMYDIRGARPFKARELGNVNPGDGALYHGRGYVQLTGRGLYAKLGALLNVDLVGNPDLALRADVAAGIMVQGMTRGIFTGKSLKSYFNGTVNDPRNARRIINGTDRADDIAEYHEEFLASLRKANV